MQNLKLNFLPPSWRRCAVVLLLSATVKLSAADGAGQGDPETTAFLTEHCWRCHGEKKAKGDLRLDKLDADLSKSATRARWREILERVRSGEMPPKDEPRPEPAPA